MLSLSASASRKTESSELAAILASVVVRGPIEAVSCSASTSAMLSPRRPTRLRPPDCRKLTVCGMLRADGCGTIKFRSYPLALFLLLSVERLMSVIDAALVSTLMSTASTRLRLSGSSMVVLERPKLSRFRRGN